MDPVTVIVRGPHDSGRTTMANLIKMFLEENGYRKVVVHDTEPLPAEQKDAVPGFVRNRECPVNIQVELMTEIEMPVTSMSNR